PRHQGHPRRARPAPPRRQARPRPESPGGRRRRLPHRARRRGPRRPPPPRRRLRRGGLRMSPPPLPDVAGLSLRAPLLRYDAGRAALTRPHAARALDGASLILQHDEGASPATSTFELTPFIAPAVQPYLPPPAVAWRTLLVDLRLLSHPEIVWTGTLPEGWNTALPPPRAEEVSDAATTLHRRYRSLVEERFSDYMLRTLECAECRADRASKIPPGLPAWQVHMRLAPTRCPH